MRDADCRRSEREEELVAPGLGSTAGVAARGAQRGGEMKELGPNHRERYISLSLSLSLFQTRSLILPFQLFTVDYSINNKYILLCVFSLLISKNLTVALIKGVCPGSSWS